MRRALCGAKTSVLLLLRQAREQRQHLDAAADGACAGARRRRGSRARRAGRRARRRSRPRRAAPELVDARRRSRRSRSWSRLSSNGRQRMLDRVQPARDLDHRRRARRGPAKCCAKRSASIVAEVTIDLQVGPARQDLAQVAEQEVDVEAALVRLVDDDRVVGAQQRIALRLGEQDAVGHQLDAGAGRQPVLEADLVADDLAERRLQLLGDALGDARRGDAARLRVADQAAAVGARPRPSAERDLRQLRRLARAGLAADDDDRVRRGSRAAISSRRAETGSDSGNSIAPPTMGAAEVGVGRGLGGDVIEAAIIPGGASPTCAAGGRWPP